MTYTQLAMNPSVRVVVTAFLALLISSANAQSNRPDAQTQTGNPQLQEIIVTATRTEVTARDSIAAISVIDGDLVQRGQPQLGLDESLNRVPGLFLQNRFNFAQDLRISNRGFGARASFGIRGIRILVDGIPATLADGQGSVDLIDLGSIERIEVLRGPASALFGNAAGGVIAIESEVGAPEPFVELRAAAGEFGYDKTQIKTAGAAGNARYMASVAHVDVDGYRDYSQARNTVINVKGRYLFGGEEGSTQLDLAVSHTDQPEANDPGGIERELATATPRAARDRNVQLGAGEDLDEFRVGGRLTHRGLWQTQDLLTAKAHLGERDFAGFIPTGNGAIGFDRRFAGGGIQYETTLRLGSVEHEWIGGVDVELQDDDRQRFENLNGVRGDLLVDQREQVENTGVFLQDTVVLNEETRVTLGLRHDRISYTLNDRFLSNGDVSGKRTLSQTSPVIGIAWAPTDTFSAYVNRATSFESPTTTELALPEGGFNGQLEPQLATSVEVGIRNRAEWRRVPLAYSVAVYQLDLEDELIPIEQADGNDVFFNAGASTRRGLELDLTAEWHPNWSSHLAYTFADFEFDDFIDSNGNDFAGNRTPGTPRHTAILSLDYQNDQGAFASLDIEHVGDIILNNANTQSSPRYTLASARAGFSRVFGKWEVSPFLGLQNIGNARYFANTRTNAFGGRFFEPGPERNLYGGITVRYTPGQ